MQPVEAGDGYSTSPAREHWFFLPGSERETLSLGFADRNGLFRHFGLCRVGSDPAKEGGCAWWNRPLVSPQTHAESSPGPAATDRTDR